MLLSLWCRRRQTWAERSDVLQMLDIAAVLFDLGDHPAAVDQQRSAGRQDEQAGDYNEAILGALDAAEDLHVILW